MYVTLQEVFELDILNEAKVLTGTNTLTNQVVEWVSVIETPVENFVRKNEFVLSTGIGCANDEEMFLQFVQEVIDSEAAALAIATGRYVFSIPDTVQQLASENNFPILTLPWEIRFADIIQGIVHKLNHQKDKLVEKSEEIQQKLLHLILRGGGLTEIANFVYKTIKQPVIITDKRGVIKAYSKLSNPLIEKWNEYLHSEEYAISLLPFESNSFVTSPNMRYITIKGNSVMQLIIHTSSEVQGYLILGDPSQDFISSTRQVQILEHAVTAIALCFLKENTVRETELRLKDDFVWSLAKGTMKLWDSILSRAKSLKYNVSQPYLCLIGYPENLEQLYKRNNPEKSPFEHWQQQMIRRIQDEVFYGGRSIYCKTMTTFQKDHLIVFLEAKDGKPEQTAYQFLDRLSAQFQQLLPELVFSWGIGKTAGVNCFNESYQEAKTAIEVGRRQKGKGHASTYADTRIDRALMALAGNDELRKITDSTIRSLLKYNEERGIDLIKTYVTYSKNRGNVSQTSRELNLHRQSLLYRLRKVEALTNCSLEDRDDVFLIDLSIKLWTIGILDERGDYS